MQVLKLDDVEVPLDRKYYAHKKAHLWVKRHGDNYRVGFDHFITENAGLLNYVTINDSSPSQGDNFGYFESAKFVSKLHAPLTGEVVKRNDDVLENPRQANEDPYGSWLVEIEPADTDELESEDLLTDPDEIEDWMRSEVDRMDEE